MEEVEDESVDLDHCEFVTSGEMQLSEEDLKSLGTIKKAVERQIYKIFSDVLVRLLAMAQKNPLAFEVFIKKMQFPHMSYSEIGNSMKQKCSKQVVLYHLKTIVNDFPELEAVIHTDTRYSGGRYALRTLSLKRKQDIALEQLQKDLYGKKAYVSKYNTVEDVNKILHAPFMVDDEVFTFNAYLKDEEHANERKTADQSGQRGVQAEGSESI